MPNEMIKWGFYIYLAIIPLIPDEINSKYRLTDIYFMLLVFSYLVNMLTNSYRREKLLNDMKMFFKDYIVIFMILLMVVMGISILYSTDKSIAIQETIRFGTYIGVLYYFISEVDIKKEFNRIIKFIYYPSFLVGIIGIFQAITKKGITVYSNDIGRISSTLGNPNSLGVYFVILIFPLITIIFFEKNVLSKRIYSVFSIVMILNIVFSFSRNAWLSLVIGLCIFAIVYNWKCIIGIFIAVGGALLYQPLNERLIGISKSVMNDGRLKHWGVALEMFKDKPINGVGNGNYVTLHSKYLESFPQ